ncbi:YcjX family protein [Galenea microaerophila]
MKALFNKVEQGFSRLVNEGAEQLDALLRRESHDIIITGLSRSGKTMFFTTLMSLLGQRVNQTIDPLPLLKALPQPLIESFELRPIPGEPLFPLDQCLNQLQNGQWPSSTDQIYGFELVIQLKQTHPLKRVFTSSSEMVFRFYDYPGELLTDLPMLQMDFIEWSNTAWSQQCNPPQKFYAQDWQAWVANFDFDRAPTEDSINLYIEAYRDYLKTAKSYGITLLQPGTLLVETPVWDWQKQGFAPLPSHISSDPSHPWTQCFQQHYQNFQQDWLRPLQENYFSKADKQIILLDLHEGLSHSRAHLAQLKETLSNLANSFVYGANKWYKPKILFGEQISKVAFVATKVDLIPTVEHDHLMQLLQDLTSGVRCHLKAQQVEFQHFLLSAIQVTDPGEHPNCLRFTDEAGQYQEWCFDPIPNTLKALEDNHIYPAIKAAVPKDVLARMNHAQGIDKLMDYIIQS